MLKIISEICSVNVLFSATQPGAASSYLHGKLLGRWPVNAQAVSIILAVLPHINSCPALYQKILRMSIIVDYYFSVFSYTIC